MMEKPHIRFEIIKSTIDSSENKLNISQLCEIAGVSRSGYYRWLNSSAYRNYKVEQDREDFLKILEAYQHRGYQKGGRSLYMYLLHQDPPVVMNIKKIR